MSQLLSELKTEQKTHKPTTANNSFKKTIRYTNFRLFRTSSNNKKYILKAACNNTKFIFMKAVESATWKNVNYTLLIRFVEKVHYAHYHIIIQRNSI